MSAVVLPLWWVSCGCGHSAGAGSPRRLLTKLRTHQAACADPAFQVTAPMAVPA